jgi:16S rRNA (uracil1498-N3)-methyltransferase
MRRRFFVDRFESNSAVLRNEAADHLGRVLRAEPGQLYELSDGQQVWLCRVEQVELSRQGQSRIEFALIESIPTPASRLQVELLLSLVKFDRLEWCLEKATELGAHTIVPLAAARTDKALISAAAKRQARWERILVESAQQSRRIGPPQLASAIEPYQAFAASSAALRILLSERQISPLLRMVLDGAESLPAGSPVTVSLAIGPEGGWTEAEFAAAQTSGFAEASLGDNILRAETAVIAGLAILNFALGR